MTYFSLSWNNHSGSFVKSLKNIYGKENFCDATLICQGKDFRVNRFVLSTCSRFFEEIFDRIKCHNPYIVLKDIEENEMELILSYMYLGEISIHEDKLPKLMLVAEALKVKGLISGVEMGDVDENKEATKSQDVTSISEDESNEIEVSGLTNNSNTQEYETNVMLVAEALKVKGERVEMGDVDENKEATKSQDVTSISEDESNEIQVSGLTNNSNTQEYENLTIKEEPFDEPGGYEVDGASEEPKSMENELLFSSLGLFSTKSEPVKNSSYIFRENSLSNSLTKFCDETKLPLRTLRSKPEDRNVNSHRKLTFMNIQQTASQRGAIKKPPRHKRKCVGPFICPSCPVRCRSTGEFERHSMIHSGEKPFKCPKCGKRFRQLFSRKRHMLNCKKEAVTDINSDIIYPVI